MCAKFRANVPHMRQLRKRLAKFMKQQRGEQTLREFATRYGLSKETVRRIEIQEQNVTIDLLEHLCKVLKCDVSQLFPSLYEEDT